VTNISVGQDSFSVEFADGSPRLVLGFVRDSTGLAFAFALYGAGPPDLGNLVTTWGAPDGNAFVAWTQLADGRATVQLGSRNSQWAIDQQPLPNSGLCENGAGNSYDDAEFGGARWVVSPLGGCGNGGNGISWTVTLPSGIQDSSKFQGLQQTPCDWGGHGKFQYPTNTSCSGWFDPDATLGVAYLGNDPTMLSMLG